MNLNTSPFPESEDIHLPPFHTVRPYVQQHEFLPYIRLNVGEGRSMRPSALLNDPPPWLDNLLPIFKVSIVTGVVLGFYKGGAKRAARFTAENAHRKPRRLKAWFYYKRSKNFNTLLGATRSAFSYTLRLTTLLSSFSLLSTLFAQSFAKAKTWRDEDLIARSLVRNYDGLGNYSKPEGEDENEKDGERKLWPNENGFDVWDWVGGVGSGMAAGGIMAVGLGLYRRWYPPTILLPALFAAAGGGFHGALNLYDARDRLQKRLDRKALLEKIQKEEEEEEQVKIWEEAETRKKEEVKRRVEEEEKRLRVEAKKEKGEWVGWVLAKMGGK